MKFANFFPLLLLFVVLAGCSKNEPGLQQKDAILKYTGPYEVDGCGFFLVVDEKEYKPANENEIDDSFKSAGQTDVLAEFILTNEEIQKPCGDLPETPSYPGVKVISLRKK